MLEQQNSFTCDICGLTYKHHYSSKSPFDQTSLNQLQRLPRLWTLIGSTLVCHQHSIAVFPRCNSETGLAVTVKKWATHDEVGFNSNEQKHCLSYQNDTQ